MRHFAPKYKSFVSYACVMDKRFPALWNTMNEHGLSRGDLDKLPLPDGADPDELWTALDTLSQWPGNQIGFNENRSVLFWANLSKNDEELARRVMKRCDEMSVIGRYIKTCGWHIAFIEGRIRSISTALELFQPAPARDSCSST